MIESQRRVEQEYQEREKKYDMPDERPRVLDWKDREHSPFVDGVGESGEFREVDISF